MQATALVHEAYIRLVSSERAGSSPSWNSRGHFFAAAAEAMRRILVENARRKKRLRHGGESKRVEIEMDSLPTRMSSDELLALDEALEKLAVVDARKARAMELKFFGGLEMAEIAEVLNISLKTVEKDVRLGAAWLRSAVSASPTA